MASKPPPWPRGRPHPTRGTSHAWAGLWGGFDDGRTKLSRTARIIERGQLGAYPPGPVRRRAARLLALAEMVETGIGSDPKATTRRLTALVAMAEKQIARLERTATQNGHGAGPTLAQIRARYAKP
jgi:hypothetical protein